jgi:ribosomal protein S18 acetylase RimI-like enzyme
MNIRNACIEDFDQINDLFWESDLFHYNKEPYIYEKTDEGHRSKNYIESLINTEDNVFIVMEIDSKIIGFLYAYEEIKGKLLIHKKRRYMVLDNIVIKENYQNKGYGNKLINYFIEYSKKKKYNDIILNVYSFNEKAIKMYEKLGFTELMKNMILKL